MNYITPHNRFQTAFISLDKHISSDNAVRVSDAFIKKTSLEANSAKINLEWRQSSLKGLLKKGLQVSYQLMNFLNYYSPTNETYNLFSVGFINRARQK